MTEAQQITRIEGIKKSLKNAIKKGNSEEIEYLKWMLERAEKKLSEMQAEK